MGYIDVYRSVCESEYVDVYNDDGTSDHYSVYTSTSEDHRVPTSMMPFAINVDITKSYDEGLVSGWASVSVNANGSIPLDWDNDIISTIELEKAAIEFMEEYRESGAQHTGEALGTVVESIVFTKAKQEAIGIPAEAIPEGWFITVKMHDMEAFAKVKSGMYKMFSIQGQALRTEL